MVGDCEFLFRRYAPQKRNVIMTVQAQAKHRGLHVACSTHSCCVLLVGAGPTPCTTLKAAQHGTWRRAERRGCMQLLWPLRGAARCACGQRCGWPTSQGGGGSSLDVLLNSAVCQADVRLSWRQVMLVVETLRSTCCLPCCCNSIGACCVCSSTSIGSFTATTGLQTAQATGVSGSSCPTVRRLQSGPA